MIPISDPCETFLCVTVVVELRLTKLTKLF